MTWLAAIALAIVGAVLATCATLVADAWCLRRRIRQARRAAELARHQALPPLPPAAWTDDTIRLAPYGACPAPDDTIAGRRWDERRQNWRNN